MASLDFWVGYWFGMGVAWLLAAGVPLVSGLGDQVAPAFLVGGVFSLTMPVLLIFWEAWGGRGVTGTYKLVWEQTLTGGEEVLERGIPENEKDQRLEEERDLLPDAPGGRLKLVPEDDDEGGGGGV